MKQDEADFILSEIQDVIFNENSIDKEANYIAVVKRSDDISIKDDYYIEIGYKEGHTNELDKNSNELKETIFDTINKNRNINNIDFNKDDITPIYSEEIELHNCKDFNEPHCTEQVKQPNGGYSVGNNAISKKHSLSGTLGATFTLADREGVYFISNFHVLSRIGARRHETILHPSRADFETAAKTKLNAKNDYNPIGTLFWFNLDDEMDAAIGKANCINSVSPGIRCLPELEINGISKPIIGSEVFKCGRSSHLTKGKIRSVNASVRVNTKYLKEWKKTHVFKKQIMTTCMSISGDSGSLLINEENKEAIGLLFAGDSKKTSFHNNLEKIFTKKIDDYDYIKMPTLKFNKFCKTKTNYKIMSVIIKIGDSTKNYTIVDNNEFILKAQFTKWSGSTVDQIVFNLTCKLQSHKIQDVYYCEDKKRLELHIFKGAENNPYTASISQLNGMKLGNGDQVDCDFIDYFEDDNPILDHCFDAITSLTDPQPKVKKGKILQGGD